MDSASKLSASAQPFGVGDALKSWCGLFDLFLEANQIVIAENLHSSTFSDIALSRDLLQRQLHLIKSSRSSIFASGAEMNNLPLAAGLAGARRVDLLKVIHSPVSLTKQDRRRAYRRKRNARLTSPPFKCGLPAVERQFINSHSSSLTDCESDFTDNSFFTSSKEGGVMDFNDSIDFVVATDSNSDYNAAFDIDRISSSEKFGVTISVLSITASTSVSTLQKFPARKSFKCSIRNSRWTMLKEIPIPAWPTRYSDAYDLFQLSSFDKNGYKFLIINLLSIDNKIHSQDSSVSLPDYFQLS